MIKVIPEMNRPN